MPRIVAMHAQVSILALCATTAALAPRQPRQRVTMSAAAPTAPHVVVVGGGWGGREAASQSRTGRGDAAAAHS